MSATLPRPWRDLRRRPGEDEEWRASSIELFFDLVFVLVVTQLSTLLYDDLTIAGAARTAFLLLVAWWAWIYTTWGTNWFDPDRGPVRAVLVFGMVASMLGAAAIPDAFGDRALLLVVGYVGIQSVRNAFMALATGTQDPLHAPLVRSLAWTLWVGAIWLADSMLSPEAVVRQRRAFRRISASAVSSVIRSALRPTSAMKCAE